MLHPIHHTFAPLGDTLQRRTALKISYAPWAYKRGFGTEKLLSALADAFDGDPFLFSTGREALLATLQCLDLKPGDEVIVQSYTCVVVPNAVHAAGAKVVYADIERETLSYDLESVRANISPKTRAIICQHTFGIPADTKALRSLCNEHGLFLIEDLAHVLPDDQGPDSIGVHADFLLLSFGRDKAISGVTGGAIVSRRRDVSDRLLQKAARATDLSWWRIARLLEYPQIYAFARTLYGSGIGKLLLFAARKLRLLLPILSEREKQGHMGTELHRMPNACALLALEQLARVQELNNTRRSLTAYYLAELKSAGIEPVEAVHATLPLQKLPLFVDDAQDIRAILKQHNIHLDDGWTSCVVCPAGVDLDALGYEWGKDPQAEKLCKQILCLPTHPTMTREQAKIVVDTLIPLLRK